MKFGLTSQKVYTFIQLITGWYFKECLIYTNSGNNNKVALNEETPCINLANKSHKDRCLCCRPTLLKNDFEKPHFPLCFYLNSKNTLFYNFSTNSKVQWETG